MHFGIVLASWLGWCSSFECSGMCLNAAKLVYLECSEGSLVSCRILCDCSEDLNTRNACFMYLILFLTLITDGLISASDSAVCRVRVSS
jgi:hypothetical protein